MPCKLCKRWWKRLWERSDAWERTHPYVTGAWSEETDRNRELIDQAWQMWSSDPDAAFRLFLEAAEAGSPWALDVVARQYEAGGVVEADAGTAEAYYRRATEAGSWPATINFARLLADLGRHEESDWVLEDGVASDYTPASFWLARLRYQRCPTRKVCREVRPLLEYSAGRGHPAAQVFLAQWLMLGRLGVREIPAGIAMVRRLAKRVPGEWREDVEPLGTAAAGT